MISPTVPSFDGATNNPQKDLNGIKANGAIPAAPKRKYEKNELYIGQYGVYTEHDYRRGYLTSFDPTDLSLHIGAYGPFRREDCKNDHNFILKDFLFCHVPSEWMMYAYNGDPEDDTSPSPNACNNIDITSDISGSPHEVSVTGVHS
jgi:hypothetical protein